MFLVSIVIDVVGTQNRYTEEEVIDLVDDIESKEYQKQLTKYVSKIHRTLGLK